MPDSLRTLVTGGAGFIGSNLTRALLEAGHTVRVVDNFSTGHRANLTDIADEIELIDGDLRERDVCRRSVDGIDVVFHVAALPSVPRSMSDPIGCHDHNVNATLTLLEASRSARVRRFVYSASSAAYGDTEILPKTESLEPLPRSPYAAAKLAGELYTLAYARAGFLEAVALRYFNVFGPRQDPNGPYAAVIPALFRSAVAGTPMTIYGDGQQTRDFTFVENVVRANILAATQPGSRVSGWVVNVGAGVRTSLLELVANVSAVTGRNVLLKHEPPREGDVRDSLASLVRAKAVLGYEPVVSLREGLQHLWTWTCQQSASDAPAPAASR
jgi:UDP-glucose 4-epimerase